MTLTRQIILARLVLAVFAAMMAYALIAGVASGYWGGVAILVPLIAIGAWALRLEWGMLDQQRPIAELGTQLREAARVVPTGVTRIFISRTSDEVILCHPSRKHSSPDQFSRVQIEDAETMNFAEPGALIHLPATTYRVSRTLPMVWRHSWVGEAVKGAEGEYHSSTPTPTSYRAALKALMLNHRTGVMVPDGQELREVIDLIQRADRALDVPGSPA
ncbi:MULTISPECIES: hypothetical protein [unclassified Streptomyces]|uniref:hypothetical protein n=1 Tax=unclassified Streptomyces TaxID=2593676 RepID=UPI0004CBF65F|nr:MULTISPECIES: hypothetical protein [unclassified Streptomyces]